MWFRDIFRTSERLASDVALSDASGLDDLTFLRRLDRLNLRVGRFLRGEAAGQRLSLRRLPASDFREHRLYLPGDDLRHVDWNASARAEHVFVKLGEQPKEATVHLLLDNSASMNWGQPSKLWAARRLAAGLGYLALSHGDRLAVAALSEGAPAFGPSHGKGRIPAMVRYLRGVSAAHHAGSGRVPAPIDVGAALHRYAARQARGGFVILISDLLDLRDFRTALDYFPLPKWQMLVIHLLHPAELRAEVRGEIELEDTETGARANYDLTPSVLEQYAAHVRAWCESLEHTCIEETVGYARVLADWPLEQMVMPYLQRRGVVELG
jgi:uncharacterized protein (DUF58 family)